MRFNPDEYREDIAEFGYTKEQQDEFLRTLWDIMCVFVDIGWGVETVQNFLPEIFEKSVQDSVNLLEEKDNHNQLQNPAPIDLQEEKRKDKS